MKQLSEVLDWIPAFAGMTKVKRVPVQKTLFLLGPFGSQLHQSDYTLVSGKLRW